MTSQRVDFMNPREFPDLPSGFDWDTQKKIYSPESLLDNFDNLSTRQDGRSISYVFCHRGFYDRASGIIDNSSAAIDNGIHHGLFLHSVDGCARNKFGSALKALRNPFGPEPSYFERLGDHTLNQIHVICLSSRTPPQKADTSRYLATNEQVSGFLASMWRELQRPTGITLQMDLRNEDLATAIAYMSFHLSKPSVDTPLSPPEPLISRLLKGTILKGYNESFSSFTHLCEEIGKKSIELYGCNYFQVEHLRVLPPIIMGFYPHYLKTLARTQLPGYPTMTRNSNWAEPCMSYDHLFRTFWSQVRSFVRIGNPGDPPYNFILEIAHSGLGLGYDVRTNTAVNPLNGEPIRDRLLFFESCVDRVMIDVSLRLRKEFPELLFSSCTRLPDFITPDGRSHEAEFIFSQMNELPQGEKGLSTKLRAMHGGLYPQSHLVVADDPAAEIAARTWIDQNSNLDRSDLLHMSYDQWLSRASPDVIAAMGAINGPFVSNMVSLVDKMPIYSMDGEERMSTWWKAQPSWNGVTGSGGEGSRHDRQSTRSIIHHAAINTSTPDNTWRHNLEVMQREDDEIRLQIGDREYRFTSETRAKRPRFSTADKARQAVKEVDEMKLQEAGLEVNQPLIRPQATNLHTCGKRKRTCILDQEVDVLSRHTRPRPYPQESVPRPAAFLPTGCECLLCHINETFCLEKWMPQESIQHFTSMLAQRESIEATRLLEQMGHVYIEPASTSQRQSDSSGLGPVRIRLTRPAVLPDVVFEELATGRPRKDYVYNPELARQAQNRGERTLQQYLMLSRERGVLPPGLDVDEYGRWTLTS